MPETTTNHIAIFKCPEDACGAYNRLNYSCSTYSSEWGHVNVYFSGEHMHLDTEYGDSETTDSDNYEYQCADCDTNYSEREIEENTKNIKLPEGAPRPNTQEELAHLYDTGKPAKTKEKVTPKTKPINGSEEVVSLLKNNDNTMDSGNECSNCDQLYATDDSKDRTCPNCGCENEE